MAKAQVRLAVGVLAVVVVCGGAFALFVKQSHGDDHRSESAKPLQESQAVVPAKPAAEPPTRLRSVGVSIVRDYFTSSGYSFEDKPLPSNVERVIGTSPNGQTVLEFVGLAALEQATLRYTLRAGSLNGQDMHAIMHLMQYLRADESAVGWAIDAARKGEPTTRTIGAVAYALQRGPNGTNEFILRPAPGFE